MPLPAAPPPHAAVAARQLPPLAFIGFRAHMPMSEARERIAAAGGTLRCKPTIDPRLRECTGALPSSEAAPGFGLLISSVRDTAAVIVLTASVPPAVTLDWARTLTEEFGRPNYRPKPGNSTTWEWIRKGQMLRVIGRAGGDARETAIALTDGPLLDALGPPPSLGPATPTRKKKPD